MSIVKRGDVLHLEIKWRGYSRIRLSTGTTLKARAKAMERTVYALKNAGRKDLLQLLADGRVELDQLHDAYGKRGDELEQLAAKAESPELGALVDQWFTWLDSPNGVSPRTRRRYAPNTVYRYRESWAKLFALLPKGRAARLSDLNKGFMTDYRRARISAGSAPGTVNRDLTALQAFVSWCVEDQNIAVARPQVRREREPAGRERWLSAEEFAALHGACPPEWWPLIATLAYTGLRVGEAQGLVGDDVHLAERRISIHEGNRHVKTPSSVRDVPIPEPLAEVLGEHFVRHRAGPADPVFPPPLSDYRALRRVWRRVCRAAGVHGATLHDCRHTFGVHCAQAGVPIVRLQKLLGHSTPAMALRYMKHAPEAYFTEDAAKVAASLTGVLDREREARAVSARAGLKRA
ncbi:MAG TPA: site-specific integrase [Gemmatimonadales bacterium]|jgi:integrase|nr:site-specific integrase [Gemmatimonadales bacterium]